jgi:hypothetical protein
MLAKRRTVFIIIWKIGFPRSPMCRHHAAIAITCLHIGDGNGSMMPAFLRIDLQNLQKSFEKFGSQIENGRPASSASGAGDENATEQLADAVANLVQQMREEQKMVRQWIQSQQVQQSEIQRLLIRSTGKGRE